MDIALKQRLVGAIVLIALAVVVLPMLLGGRPDEGDQERQTIELPPQPSELDFQTRKYPIGETLAVPKRPEDETSDDESVGTLPQPETDGGVDPRAVAHVELAQRDFQDARPEQEAPTPASDAEAPASDVDTAPQPPVAEAAAPVREVASPVSATGGDGGRYVVQVASFGSIANANRLAETLRGSGNAVLTDTVTSDVGTLHRVRVGPYGSEAEAGAVATRLSQQISDVRPRVVDLQPDKAAQVTTPSDPLVRWVVQLGSFSSTGNADKLIVRVRAEGFSAYKEEISSSGSTIYRVRVGPFLERDEAIRVDRVIGERLSVDGVVMSAD
jgi:DedD protein